MAIDFGTVDVGGSSVSVSNFPATQPVSGPLTDTQLRAVAVPVSGTVTATGPLTDTQLRATAVPVSGNVNTGGTLNNGVSVSVTQVAAQMLAANANRKKLIIQSQSAGTICIGTTGVTTTTGIQMAANSTLTFDMPNCPTNAIFGIRTASGSTTVLVQEVV